MIVNELPPNRVSVGGMQLREINLDGGEIQLHVAVGTHTKDVVLLAPASAFAPLDLNARSAIIPSIGMASNVPERKKLSRQERQNLDIEIGFIEGVVNRDPDFLEALQVLGDDYTRRGRFTDGLKIDERLAQIRPDDSMVQYNLACSYALTDRIEPAAEALERALNLGYRDFKWLNDDPDLEKLRQHPIFRKIRTKIRSLRVKSR